MVEVREVRTGEWDVLRDVRLAALNEAPYAFSSTYVREASFTEEQWRGRLASWGVLFFAFAGELADGEPAGLAGVWEEDGAADLVSMWVRPVARGMGVGEELVTAAADWAKARDYDTLHLWVTESNAPARKLYERCGFTPTGEQQPLPSDPSLPEIGMSRRL
jgi:ribosomal protein S18 acetylase RimI-like enzyme